MTKSTNGHSVPELEIQQEHPAYWLGQVDVICRLEKAKKLTPEEAIAQVNETLNYMRSGDQRPFMERRKLTVLAAEAGCEKGN